MTEPTRRKLEWKLWHKLTLIGVALAVLLPILLLWVVRWSGQRAVAAVLQEAVDAGGWASVADFPPDDVSEEDNAAPLWLAAFAERDRADEAYGSERAGEISSWPQSIPTAELEAYLEEHAETFRLAEAAAARPACVWPYNYGDAENFFAGDEAVNDALGYSRRLARLLACRIELSLRQEDWAAVDRDLVTMSRVAEDIGRVPLLIHQLVGTSIHALCDGWLQEVPAKHLKRLMETHRRLKTRQTAERYRRAALGEVAYIHESPWDPPRDDDVHEVLYRLALLWEDHDQARWMRQWLFAADRTAENLIDNRAWIDAQEAVAEELPWMYLVCRKQLEGFGWLSSVSYEQTRRAAALWLYELATTGALAGDAAFAGRGAGDAERYVEGPTDPATGRPLRGWHAPDGGFVIWSPYLETVTDYGGWVQTMARISGTQQLPAELEFLRDSLIDEPEPEEIRQPPAAAAD
jgi:hypothetical protein